MVDLGIAGLGDAEFVGRGGFGHVYRCEQTALNRTVAVKVIRAQEASAAELSSFERECAVVGSLDWCPEIVSVFSTGTTPDGDPYMVMEYAPGGSIREQLKEQGIQSESWVRSLAVHMARALAAAHQAGLLHRDVKPANILISRSGKPLLADFGIARTLARSGNTSTAAVTGTIAYMAPELLQEQPATAASDVFSLGATLLEALTGRTPFSSGSSNTAASMIRRAIQAKEVDLSDVDISDDFRQVLMRCLAIDPDSRYASGSELLASLTAEGSAPVQEDTIVRTVAPPPMVDGPPSDDATVVRPRTGGRGIPPAAPPTERTVLKVPAARYAPTTQLVESAGGQRPNKALLVSLIGLGAVLFVAAIVIVTILLTGSGNKVADKPDAGQGQGSAPSPDSQESQAVPASEGRISECWDGERVESGTPCNVNYDERAVRWVFNIDSAKFECNGGGQFDNSWSYADDECVVPPGDIPVHVAVYSSASSRDSRRVKFGVVCASADRSKAVLRCTGGAKSRKLLSYDSDQALFYVSAPVGRDRALAFVQGRMRSLDEVLYGIELDQ